MRIIPFTVERGTLSASSDAAYVIEGETLTEGVRLAIWQSIRLDVNVTIGGVTAPAAFWEDPGHWTEDWAEVLGVELEGAAAAVEAVEEILAAAIKE